MTTLDAIRAEIVDHLDYAQRCLDRTEVERDAAARAVAKYSSELEAHDRAVAAMNGTGARRNIAALVLAQLTAEPQTVEALAKAIDAQPRQVTEALGRLGSSKVEGTSLGWVRAGGLAL